jgi:DNA-directed RNA polymerase specialized sigma24 family protein
MSKIAELAYDIEQLYIDGLSAAGIAAQLNCPIGVVKGWIEGNSVADTQQEEDEIYSPYNGA